MALTPEDVVNKRFESTKFREGYDQDDVDDFLDEVVVELRRLNNENEELRQRLTAAEAHSSELQQSANSAPAAIAAAAPVAAVAPAAIESAPAVAAPVAPAAEPVSSALDDASSTNNLLQLARRLHEEHVRDGVAKRDALIAEGQTSAAELVAEAEAQQRAQLGTLEQEREEVVGSLKKEREAIIDSLNKEREEIEGRIESLRSFEREYRQKLKSYIEGQLEELDAASLVSAGASSHESTQQDAAQGAQPAGQLTPEDFAAPQSAQQPPASFTGFSGS
ncbi:DivIVA domain-containing protein [Salinibacterium sp. M195]|uniref:DivIVA domain-containing protein n=1 Tax=Salinibacterium sp. M195 TaxID=2583374 RepID=UPI001C62D6B2|nr:DivIVA domain-containing protein [Salinibacterium sp. M195]QYH36283.1 DivIVA domain-containing protein [Salinibacterium sp. M195]